MSHDENTRVPAGVDIELEAQELEEMDAPGWDSIISAMVSLGAGISVGVAIT